MKSYYINFLIKIFYTKLCSVFCGIVEYKITVFHQINKLFYNLYNMVSEQICSPIKVRYLLFNDPTALISIIIKQAERVVSKVPLSLFCHC